MATQSISALDFKPSQIGMGICWLLLGTDAWLIDSVLDPIRSELKKQHGVDIVHIYGDEIKAPQLNDVLDTLSIFSTQKLVILRNAAALANPELQALARYVANPSDSQSLVIIHTRPDLKAAAWKPIRQACLEIKCDPPRSAWALKPWLEANLSKADRKMDPQAAEMFLARVELDYASAYNELQKLFLLSGANQRISAKDVNRSVGTSRVGTMADFYRALGKRDLKATLITVQRMLDSEWEALQVFFQFCKFYSQIHKILALRKQHVSPAEISAKHLPELYPDQRKEFLNFSAAYSISSIRAINSVLLETDSALKLSVASPATLLELCAIRIMQCR